MFVTSNISEGEEFSQEAFICFISFSKYGEIKLVAIKPVNTMEIIQQNVVALKNDVFSLNIFPEITKEIVSSNDSPVELDTLKI